MARQTATPQSSAIVAPRTVLALLVAGLVFWAVGQLILSYFNTFAMVIYVASVALLAGGVWISLFIIGAGLVENDGSKAASGFIPLVLSALALAAFFYVIGVELSAIPGGHARIHRFWLTALALPLVLLLKSARK